MGAAAPGGGVPWTPEAKHFLIDNPHMEAADAATRLGKSVHAVNHMRRTLGLSRKIQKCAWTGDEDEYLHRAKADKKTSSEMARHLARSKNSINARLKKLGITTPLSAIRLSEGDKKFIVDHPDMSGEELSRRLGFRPSTLLRHRRELGLPPLLDRSEWTKEEVARLRSNLNRKLPEIYKMFPHRSHASVSIKAQALGRRRRNNKGFSIGQQGYKSVYDNGKPVLEHHKVMEEILGRKMLRGEVVHHINRDREDNRPENLVPFGSHSEHMKAEYSYGPLVAKMMELGMIKYSRSTHEYYIGDAVSHHRQSTLPC